MASAYDEDLKDNAFYQTLYKDYGDILYKVIMEGCVICVPRAGSLPSYGITLDDILGHIIIPNDEMPESHFHTLNGKEIKICNRAIHMEYATECLISIQILFEETYYTDDLLKYKVLCIEHPLEPKPEGHNDGVVDLRTLRDCMAFLTDGLLKEFDKLVDDLEESRVIDKASIQTVKELSYGLYKNCVEIASQCRVFREQIRVNQHAKKNLRLAVETYVGHKLYKIVFQRICDGLGGDNANLNKIIRNLEDVQIRDLEIRAELHDLIPKARTELGKLDGYSTVLGKLSCLKKMMGVISRDPESGGMLATDDMLPIIVFLVLKTNITNWCSHLLYMKEFNFAASVENMGDEDEFLITTLEAAVEHVKSNALGKVMGFLQTPGGDNLLMELFHCIAGDDLQGLEKILDNSKNFPRYGDIGLCHPLCECDNCDSLVKRNTPTLESCDDNGINALHVAAIYGRPAIIDYILSQNFDPDVTDSNGNTALHYAALRGHQHVLLLLLQMGAEINLPDNGLNTALHFASINGHLPCVKALIYHSEHEGIRLLVNAQNSSGNTPLHHAAKYGYQPIVEILLDYHADPTITNRQKLTPFHTSNNPTITKLLSKSKPPTSTTHKQITFDFQEETPDMRSIPGDQPSSPTLQKNLEKLLKAASHGDINLVKFYLNFDQQKKHLPRVNMCNMDGYTALHISASNGFYELANLLIKNHANLDIQTRSKLYTPLILACQNQRIKLAKLLLESGCKINMFDSKANTALHYACIVGNRRLVEVLLQYQPKLSMRNKMGRTALQEAEAKMALGIADMLRACQLNCVL